MHASHGRIFLVLISVFICAVMILQCAQSLGSGEVSSAGASPSQQESTHSIKVASATSSTEQTSPSKPISWTQLSLSQCSHEHPAMIYPLRVSELSTNLECSSLIGPQPNGGISPNGGASSGRAPPRFGMYNMQLAYDAADGYLLLFGATGAGPQNGTETWTYHGGTWTNLNLTPSPESCMGSIMAYDSFDGYVLYFAAGNFGSGGQCSSAGQTWAFNGGAWTQLHPAASPPVRQSAAMTNDTGDGYMLLFGGACNQGTHLTLCGDTWTYLAGTWTNITGSNAPAPRAGAGLTYDASDGYVLLFGGTAWPESNNYPLTVTDTWEFKAGVWTQIPIGGVLCGGPSQPSCGMAAPPGPYNDGLTYDASDGIALYTCAENNRTYSGYMPPEEYWTYHAGTWTDLNNWTLHNINWLPVNRLAEGLSYDYVDGYAIMFGGIATTWAILNDTWSYHSGVWTNRTGFSVTVTATPTSGTVPLNVTFGATAGGGTGPYSYSWNFGDGSLVSTAQSPVHQYNATGNFTATVTAKEANGTTTTGTVKISVSGVPPLTLSSIGVPNCGAAPLNVTFTDGAAGGSAPYSWFWNFTDGNYAYIQNPQHTFYSTGTYQVFTEVTDSKSNTAWRHVDVDVTSGGCNALTSVAVSPSTASIYAGSTQSFTATPTCIATCPLNITYSWTLTGMLGTLNAVTGTSVTFTAGSVPGTTGLFVNATLGGYTVETHAIITITSPPYTLESVALNPVAPVLAPGGTQGFTVTPTCNVACPSNIAYWWDLTNSTIGYLNARNLSTVTFTANDTLGTFGIFVNATLDSITQLASTVVTITSNSSELADVSITPIVPTVAVGDTQAFVATPKCTSICPPGATYSWSLTSSVMGSISSNHGSGVTFTAGVTAVIGGIFVNATLNGVTMGTHTVITITASTVTLTSVVLNPLAASMAFTGTQTFEATPECSSTCPSSGITYDWTLTNDAMGTIAGVGASVIFTAGMTTGTVSIFVNATLSGFTKVTSAIITISATPTIVLSGVSISPSSVTLSEGAMENFSMTPICTFGGNDTTCPSTGIAYSWALSDVTMGTLSLGSVSSVVTFTAGDIPGVVTLTGTAKLRNSELSSVAAIAITATYLTSVSLNQVTVSLVAGGTQTFTATPVCLGGTCPAVTTYKWALSNPSMGTLNSTTGRSVTFTAGSTAGNVTLFVNVSLYGRTVSYSAKISISGNQSSSPITTWLILVVIVCAVCVVLALMVARRAKQKRLQEAAQQEDRARRSEMAAAPAGGPVAPIPPKPPQLGGENIEPDPVGDIF